MTNQAIISKLSELPADKLNEVRMAFAILLNSNGGPPIKTCERWIKDCNQALEQKQFDYFVGYEDVTNNPIGI